MRSLQLHPRHIPTLPITFVHRLFPQRGLDAETLARADARGAQVGGGGRGYEVEEGVCEVCGYGVGGGAEAGFEGGREGGGGDGVGGGVLVQGFGPDFGGC